MQSKMTGEFFAGHFALGRLKVLCCYGQKIGKVYNVSGLNLGALAAFGAF